MNLGTMATHITTKLGKTDTSSVSACKEFIRNRFEMINDAGLWKDMVVVKTFNLQTRDSTDSNPYTPDVTTSLYEQELTLPYEIVRPINVIYNKSLLGAADLQTIFHTQADSIDTIGTPVTFTEVEPIAVSKLTSSDPFKVQLKPYVNAADSGKEIHFKGLLDQRPVHEDLALTNGSYYGSQDFDELICVSKPVTLGEVQFSNGASTETVPAEETRYQLARIRLNLKPQYVSGETVPLVVLGKRRIRPMRHDSDEPQIRNIDNALIAYVTGDMLERSRQYGKAQIKNAEGVQLVQVAQNVERSQSAATAVIQPNTLGDYDRNDFNF